MLTRLHALRIKGDCPLAGENTSLVFDVRAPLPAWGIEVAGDEQTLRDALSTVYQTLDKN